MIKIIDIIDIENIIHIYGFKNKVIEMVSLQESIKPKQQIRLIYKINLENGLNLICRISNEINYSNELIEQQCNFSEKLRLYGIPVARKYKNGEKYCISYNCNGYIYSVILEDYVGKDLEYINLATFNYLGRILGKMHVISEKDPSNINYSPISKAINDGRAKFDNILAHTDSFIKKLYYIQEIRKIHDELVLKLKDVLYELPHGAVHGDLSIYNNLVKDNDGTISIIDFNLSGDEVFLCDMLMCFFSSVYKYSWKDKMKSINHKDALFEFMSGYFSERKLSEIEKKYFCITAALFDGLFYSKSIIEEYNSTDDKNILEKFKYALDKFEIKYHQYNEYIY